MKILVINCGSSSLKYQLIDMDNESVVAKGLCERIGIEGSKLTHQPAGKDKYVVEKPNAKPHCSHQHGYGGFTGHRARRYHRIQMKFLLSDTAYCTLALFTVSLS